jgi:O-antigen ligase
MIRNQPIIGVGPGNWRIQYPAFASGGMIDSHTEPHRPHNDLLTIWSESGIAALGLYLALLFHSFRNAWRAAAGADRALVAAAAASVVACVANGFFSFPKEFVAASAPLWFGIGVLARFGPKKDRTESKFWCSDFPGRIRHGPDLNPV